jgi:hypothetical protein
VNSRRAGLAVLLLVIGAIVFTGGPPRPKPIPSGTFAVAILGDAPYYWWEDLRFRQVRQSLNEHELSAVIHIGDIFWRPCSDAMYMRTRDRFNRLRHPVVYTPGDNEWTDCWEPRVGGDAPLERLARLRQIFYSDPSHSLGARKIALQSQPGQIENARWDIGSVVFATVHIVGSQNGAEPFPGRTAANDEEVRQRTSAAYTWVAETFDHARRRNAAAVVFAFHSPYTPLLNKVSEEAERFGKPVLIAHGDEHHYTVDHPLRAQNVTRLEVPGSPDVGWVRVIIDPRAANPFSFEKYVVPRWKWW